jgi:cytochrome b561
MQALRVNYAPRYCGKKVQITQIAFQSAQLAPGRDEIGGAAALFHATTMGDTILWVAGFHAVAALFHHFYLRDRVLLSMLPRRWRELSGKRPGPIEKMASKR